MPISYNKNIPVVFLVQEGDEAPRPATEEDLLRAGYVPAERRFDSVPVGEEPSFPVTESAENTTSGDIKECDRTCEDCVFLNEDHTLVDLLTIPEFIVDGLTDLKGAVSDIFSPKSGTNGLDSLFKNLDKKVNLTDFKGGFLDPLFAPVDFTKYASGADTTPAPEKTANPEPAKEESPTAPKEEVPAEKKPEFTSFEQTIIDKFGELGLGGDAASAMRKSKELTKLLGSSSPLSEEDAKRLSELLKGGGSSFFGGK